MKISVIIPTYNAEATIQDAIASCLKQTLPAYEIIVVDDASTDNTTTIVSSLENITLIKLTENSGPSTARNTGWNVAKGDYIAFLDSDDVWHPEKIEHISNVFASNESISYLGHKYVVGSTTKVTEAQPEEISFTSILLKNPYQPSCLAIKRQLPYRFDESYRYCEDHELSVRVASKHKCYFLPTTLTSLGRPQLAQGGASSNKIKMRLGELRIYSYVYKHKPLLLPFIPVLWIYSLCKMLYRSIS